MVTRRKTASRRKTAGRKTARGKGGRWSARVTRHSNALDLENAVFKSSDPHRIALSLKRSAERSRRRKASPYQSAMSMLTFYINRAGRNLPKRKLRTLQEAKTELRKVFHRD
jgi:hypothetical protein